MNGCDGGEGGKAVQVSIEQEKKIKYNDSGFQALFT